MLPPDTPFLAFGPTVRHWTRLCAVLGSAALTWLPVATAAPEDNRLLNLSSRAWVGAGDDVSHLP